MAEQNLKFSVVGTTIQPPAYEENTNSRTYVSWGADNQFPAFINRLYEESATVGAIVDGSATYICGNGVIAGEGAAKFAEAINRKGETFEDLCEKLAVDLMKFNGFAIQVIYNKLGAVEELYALDFGRCRISADGKKVYYASKWGQWTSKYKIYDAFNRDCIDPLNMTQIYFYKGSARTCYPKPTWQGCYRDAMAEIAADKYVLNSLSNGLAVKTVLTLPNEGGILTDDEKAAIEKSIKERFCGPDADSSFFLYFQENSQQALKVDTIAQEKEADKFLSLKKSARENIFTAFRCSPNVFGLSNDNAGVFSKDNYFDAFDLYNRTQIRPRQKQIVRVLDKILAGEKTITFKPFTLEDE